MTVPTHFAGMLPRALHCWTAGYERPCFGMRVSKQLSRPRGPPKTRKRWSTSKFIIAGGFPCSFLPRVGGGIASCWVSTLGREADLWHNIPKGVGPRYANPVGLIHD